MIPMALLRCEPDTGHKFVFMAPPKDTIINKNLDQVYVISFQDEKHVGKQKYERYNIRFIEKSNMRFTEMSDYTKKNVNDIINTLRNELSAKNIVNTTRSSLRKEFYNIYKNKESDIFKKAKQEFDKK